METKWWRAHSVLVTSQVIFRIRNRGSFCDFLVETFQGDFQVGWQSSIHLVEYLVEAIYEGTNVSRSPNSGAVGLKTKPEVVRSNSCPSSLEL